MDAQPRNTLTDEETHYCEVHPENEATLRCIRCQRWMCIACIVKTPTGYMCRQCDRQHEDKFFSGTNYDYIIVFGVSMALSALAGIGALLMGWFFAFIIGGVAGAVIGEAGRRATGRRIGRNSGQIAAGGIFVGALLSPTLYILVRTGLLIFSPQMIVQDFGLLIFAGVAAASAYAIYQRRI